MKSDMSRRYHTRVVTNILYSAVISCLVEIFLVTNVSMIARYMEESGRMNRLLQAVLDYSCGGGAGLCGIRAGAVLR